jgi:hypothetical protein
MSLEDNSHKRARDVVAAYGAEPACLAWTSIAPMCIMRCQHTMT